MGNSWNAIQVALALSLVASMPALAASYRYTDIVVPGAIELSVIGIGDGGMSNTDTVVGGVELASGTPQYQGFVWSHGTSTLVPGTSGFEAIDQNGHIAAGNPPYPSNPPGVYTTYSTTSGAVTTVDTGINAVIAGASCRTVECTPRP